MGLPDSYQPKCNIPYAYRSISIDVLVFSLHLGSSLLLLLHLLIKLLLIILVLQ